MGITNPGKTETLSLKNTNSTMITMVRFWLMVTNLANWELVRDRDVYGFDDRNQKYMVNLSEGDCVVIYVKPKMLGGIFKIENRNFNGLDMKFKDGHYPHKIKLDKLSVPDKPIKVREDIVRNISIFKGTKRWGTVLMGRSLREITESDFGYIKSLMVD